MTTRRKWQRYEPSESAPWAVKAAVRKRDGNRCTECGITAAEHIRLAGKTLEVHRLVPGSPYTVDGAVTLCRSCHGPKPKSPYRTRGSRPVFKCPKSLYKKVQMIAAHRGIKVADLFSEILDPLVHEDYLRLPTALKQKLAT